ncbi:MAG: histidinol dehydrogenase, partial [Bacteroidota bacterium]|nr:histidinol dehydrogenase [Bacteroidota bacterium]
NKTQSDVKILKGNLYKRFPFFASCGYIVYTMLKIIDLRTKKNLSSFTFHSTGTSNAVVEKSVADILARVKRYGDAALRHYSKNFDGVSISSISVTTKEISEARRKADPKFVAIVQQSIRNIRRFHEHQKRTNWKLNEKFGSTLRQLFLPIEKVGVYVPGGKAAYPSTVLMNVIPAQTAGVKEIHLVSPPDKKGNIHPDVLLAASLLGIKNVYRVGGAQAVGALAYGTDTIPAVDKIVGPGNIFVATAKKMVYGIVGIDSFAGPSEVVILADNSADASFVAADMLAQSEHDERASSILVTPSRSFAEKVKKEIDRHLSVLPRQEIMRKALNNQGKIFIVKSVQQGVDVVNMLAPEHLEIITTNAEQDLKNIKHAGSIFLGNYSPVAIGDYYAGPNHVLPTERTARFSSPLTVDDFIKKSSVIQYSQKHIEAVADTVATFAEHEGLTAHALSLRLRKKR